MSEYTDNPQDEVKTIPNWMHEKLVWHLQQVNKRLWIALLIVFVTLVATNVLWVVHEMQYIDEEYTYTIEQDSGEGGSNTYQNNHVVVGGGSIGEDNYDGDSETENP